MIFIDILEGGKLKIRAEISMGVNRHHSSLTAESCANLEQLLFGLYCFLDFFPSFISVNHGGDHRTEDGLTTGISWDMSAASSFEVF